MSVLCADGCDNTAILRVVRLAGGLLCKRSMMRRSVLKQWLGVAVAMLGLAGCAADHTSPSELDAARSRFAALGWARYHYTFERTGFGPSGDGAVTVFVENGNVVQVIAAATGEPLSTARAASYSTIEGLHAEVARQLDSPEVRVEADFDPRGIPVRAYFDGGEEGAGFEVTHADRD